MCAERNNYGAFALLLRLIISINLRNVEEL
jgi:hypothetical protein